MRQPPSFYRELFGSTFRISAFTFGGGFVIIPLMRKSFVEKKNWLQEQEMLDLSAIAQSAPGPIAVNTSLLVGYRLAGMPGALVAIAGTVLPPFIILSIVSMFYTAFRDSALVAAVLRGMQAGIAAVIVDVVVSLAGGILREKSRLWTAVMAAAFVAVWFFKVNVMAIILLSGLLGLLVARGRAAGGEEGR